MAELVDAADSKSAVRKDVLVRFQSRAQVKFKTLISIEFDRGFSFQGTLKGTFLKKNKYSRPVRSLILEASNILNVRGFFYVKVSK